MRLDWSAFCNGDDRQARAQSTSGISPQSQRRQAARPLNRYGQKRWSASIDILTNPNFLGYVLVVLVLVRVGDGIKAMALENLAELARRADAKRAAVDIDGLTTAWPGLRCGYSYTNMKRGAALARHAPDWPPTRREALGC